MIDLDNIPLYCLHIPSQVDREDNMIKELNYFRPSGNYIISPAERRFPGYDGVSRSFKNVIREAKLKEYDKILIFEDDIQFTSDKSKEHFQSALNTLPNDWDIVLGCSYGFKGVPYNEYFEKVTRFTSFICVIFRETVYDKLLSHNINNIKHIDAYISSMCDQLNVYITHPMICKQYDNAYSSNKHKIVDYSKNIINYKFITN